jgi:nucleoside phosphorylase
MGKIKPLTADDFTVGWICAITKELEASAYMFDVEYDMSDGRHNIKLNRKDTNSYRIGKIKNHNVVMVCIPHGSYGIASAAIVAGNMSLTFKCLTTRIMVGIAAGIPKGEGTNDVRLGDVVISSPNNNYRSGGVENYEYGKMETSGHRRTGTLPSPSRALLSRIQVLQSKNVTSRLLDDVITPQLDAHLKNTGRRSNKFLFPGALKDTFIDYRCDSSLHPSSTCITTIRERESELCSICRSAVKVSRPDNRDFGDNPIVHYGIIASGSSVVKTAVGRDKIRAETGAICIEMEAAGLMQIEPAPLIIRGICDYADSSKNDDWHAYAAIAAAAYARVLIQEIQPTDASASENPVRRLFSGNKRRIKSN